MSEDYTLWDAGEVAAYLGVSRRQVTERLQYIKGFPRPVRLSVMPSARGRPRWYRSEICAYVRSCQEKAA